MTKMTSAYANKVIKKLRDDKAFYLRKEADGYCYIAALDEEPVIPEYDYQKTADTIAEIDNKIITIKHAVNLVNATNELDIQGTRMTIDAILVKMAQLSSRRDTLDRMRKMEPKTRINSGSYQARKTSPEYQYINYDLELIKKEYERVDSQIATMQMALDKFNQTFEFEVNI